MLAKTASAMGDLQMFPVENRRIAAKVNRFHCFLFHDEGFFSWSQDGKMLSREAEAPPKHVKKVRPMEKENPCLEKRKEKRYNEHYRSSKGHRMRT